MIESEEKKIILGENILLIDKEAGWTSNDVVTFLKKKFNPIEKIVLPNGETKKVKKVLGQDEKRFRIGHAGTLDPFATGLLLIMLNDATKKFDYLQTFKKEYIAEIEFGKETDTYDVYGKINFIFDEANLGVIDLEKLGKEFLEKKLQKYLGKIKQTPPIFSAVKQSGVPAYKLAYLGKKVETKEREVEVFTIEILKIEKKVLTVKYLVSSGTYIRTLGFDLGKDLGYGAFLKSLRRTKIGEFKVEDAKKVSQL